MKPQLRSLILNVGYLTGGGAMLLWGGSLIRVFIHSQTEHTLDISSLLIGVVVIGFGAFLVWIVARPLYDDWQKKRPSDK